VITPQHKKEKAHQKKTKKEKSEKSACELKPLPRKFVTTYRTTADVQQFLFVWFFFLWRKCKFNKKRRSSPGVRTCGSATPASRKNDLFRKSPLWFLSCCASREILLLVERPVNRASSKIKTRKKKKLVLTAQRESNQRFQRALLPPTSGRPPLLVPSRW